MTGAITRRSSSSRSVGLGRRWTRRLWAAVERMLGAGNTCDRCQRAMLDYRERDRERVCILCVAEERACQVAPPAPPELAGCAAVLRALLLELDAAAAHPATAPERRRVSETVDLALNIAWWMTPPNLRIPSQHNIDELVLLQQLAAFENRWALATGTRSLWATYQCWRGMQLKAAQYAELADVDRRYAALRQAEDSSALTRGAMQQGGKTCAA